MKSITPDVRAMHARIFAALFISFVILVTPVLPLMAASARLANDVKSKLPTTDIRPADAGAVIPSEALSPLPLPAPNITATKVDSFPDPDNDGKAVSGETISYTIQVNNSGANDATGVTFADTVDANTTFVPGSLRVSPLAFADTYFTAQGDALTVSVPGDGVLANDKGTPNPSAVPIVAGATTGGGTVTLNANGTFTYTPAPAFTGADTFTYTVTNGQAPNDTATVTINVDAAPTVVNTSPADNATGISTNTNITVTFSESVSATNSSFNIECPAGSGSQAFNLSASPSTTFTLDPVADLPASTTCTVTVVANQISDTDTNDAPDNMAANFVFSFSVAAPAPVAVDDTRDATGNIRIDTSGSGFSVLSNDTGAGLTITASDSTSARGGQVNVNTATGTFTYNPPAGYEGPDSFNYTISNGGGSDVGTVNITVAGMIWFINSAAPSCAANCGRLTNPFSSLASFEIVNGGATPNGIDVVDPEAGDHIFIYSGSYTGPLTLESNQQVIGQGATSTVSALSGVTLAPDSDPLPATGGANPSITSSTDGIILAQNNSLHGLTVTNTAGIGVSGNGFGTLTVSEHVIVDNTTGVPVNLVNGNLAATFESISSNGAASGIVLNTTTGSFAVSGNGGTCTSAATCTGGAIQNSTSMGVSLTNATNISLDHVFIQNSANSGIKGTQVDGFSFTNGVIDNSGTGGGVDTSNIAFNTSLTIANLSGAVTITGNTLTNALYHGIDITNRAGTISDANISNNVLTSSNVTANSLGSGIRVLAFGNAATVASITKATIDNNQINNFPTSIGMQVQCGNATAAGPAGICGVAGSATDIINITNNQINDPVNGSTVKTGGEGILGVVNGKGQGNFNINTNRVFNNTGTSISLSAFGQANVTATVSNNKIEANNIFGSSGIGVGTGVTSGFTNTPVLTIGIANNDISKTDGNGILAAARGNAVAMLNVTIKSNIVAAPLTSVRQGIRVDAGNSSLGDNAVCLDINGNTSAGSGGALGIGLRKQGAVTTIHDFGIEGMVATASPGVEAYVDSQNPTGGGTQIILGTGTATSGFSSCSSAPVAYAVPETNRRDDLAQNIDALEKDGSASSAPIAQAASIFSDATAGAIEASFEEQALASNFSNESTARMELAHGRKMGKTHSLMEASATATGHVLMSPMPSGETINATIGTLPAGKSVTITFQVTVNNSLPTGTTQVSNQGSISGSNFSTVLTDDPAAPGAADPTVTPVFVFVDTEPPVIVLTTGVIKLWPPDHGYKTFQITDLVASVSDAGDPSVDINDVVISQVTSDEVEDGPSDGSTLNDIVIASGCKSVQLRAERQGTGNGRVYKITLKVKDASGNVATAVRQVIVPVNNNGSATDSGVQYTVNGCNP